MSDSRKKNHCSRVYKASHCKETLQNVSVSTFALLLQRPKMNCAMNYMHTTVTKFTCSCVTGGIELKEIMMMGMNDIKHGSNIHVWLVFILKWSF